MAHRIRAAADELCLVTGPLRFTACTKYSDLWAAQQLEDKLLLTNGPVKLWQAGTEPADASTRLCIDKLCIRCLSRGNANRANPGLCLQGHEPVLVDTPTLSDRAPNVLFTCLVLAVLAAAAFLWRRMADVLGSSNSRAAAAADEQAMGTTEALEAAKEQSRKLRVSLRSSRDEARPVRLLHTMLAGESFTELDEDGNASAVWLEISPDQLRLRAFATKRGADAGEAPVYELELASLRKISFGQSTHPAARSSQYTQTPWRCFAVDAAPAASSPAARTVPPRGDHFFVGQRDDSAINWVQGLQSLLHASGQLEQPLPPAKLLWLRARMRLLQRAAKSKSNTSSALAEVVRKAVRNAHKL